MADQRVIRARERVAELRSPLRRALAALSEVEGILDEQNVLGRYVIAPNEDGGEEARAAAAYAQDEYPGHEITVVVIIGDKTSP